MRVESDLSQEKLVRAKIPGTETGIEVKKTICSVCVAQCGINAYVLDGRLIKVEGAEENPTNRGRLCVKGTANRQYVYHPDRILTPLMRTGERGSGEFVPISWDEALDRIASRLIAIRQEWGRNLLSFSPVSLNG